MMASEVIDETHSNGLALPLQTEIRQCVVYPFMSSVSTFSEIRRTLALAFPIIIGHLGQMLMGIVDSVMIGRVGTVPLAASAFGHSLFTISFILGVGLLMAVSVLGARAHGAGQSSACAEYLRHGMLMAAVLGTGGALVIYGMSLHLEFFGQPEEVNAAGETYIRIIAFSLVPTLFFQVLRQYSEALGFPWGAMGILLLSVVLNVVLNWVLIYGNLGAPALGLDGAGWATLLSRIFAVAGLWFWLKHGTSVAREWPGRGGNAAWWAHIDWARIREMLRIGVPAAGQLMFEAGAFVSAAMMMGWIGTVPLAAHQIALSCASATFMIPLGIGLATAIRIGRAVGEGREHALRRIGFGSIFTAVAFAVIFTGLFVLTGPLIVSGFTHEADVASLAAELLIIAAIFQIFDGGQAVASGALRGLTDVKVPTVITFISYWMMALPTGYFFGVQRGDPHGVWIGLAVGLAVAYLLLSWRFYLKTEPGSA